MPQSPLPSRSPAQSITYPYNKWGLTLPARLAIVIAFLIANIGLALGLALYTTETASAQVATGVAVSIAIIAIAIGFISKGLLTGWANETAQPLPVEVASAWDSCLKKTRDWSITLQDKPLIVMIGFRDSDHATSFMTASDEEFTILSESQEFGAVQLFSSEEANFLSISGVSSLSGLTQKLEDSGAKHKSAGGAVVDPDKDVFEDTVFGQDFAEQGATIDLVVPQEDFDMMLEGNEEHHHATIGNPGEFDNRQVMSSMMQKTRLAAVAHTDAELDDFSENLRALLQHLGLARTPRTTIDGLLVNLSFDLLAKDNLEEQIEKSLQNDIRTIRDSLDELFPVYIVVGGMERESGFRELVRRIGKGRVKKHRFGSGFEAWGIPTTDSLEVLCDKACAAFEEWVFYLFKEEGGIRKRGNPKLYTLLCQIRGKLRERLQRLVGRVFSVSENAHEVPCLFSGCYFAATGNREDQQAFVRGLFKRVTSNTNKGFWTEKAIQKDSNFKAKRNMLHNINLVLTVLLVSGICGLFLKLYQG